MNGNPGYRSNAHPAAIGNSTRAVPPSGLDFTGVLPDGVDITEARAGSYAATGALTPADLAAITAWWAVRGIMPSSLSLEARSLEDVFLDISGREIR